MSTKLLLDVVELKRLSLFILASEEQMARCALHLMGYLMRPERSSRTSYKGFVARLLDCLNPFRSLSLPKSLP